MAEWLSGVQRELKTPSWERDWTFAETEISPIQSNGKDCGVFLCLSAYFSSQGKNPVYNITRLAHFRELVWRCLERGDLNLISLDDLASNAEELSISFAEKELFKFEKGIDAFSFFSSIPLK